MKKHLPIFSFQPESRPDDVLILFAWDKAPGRGLSQNKGPMMRQWPEYILAS
jgi:hypothetical protein